MIQEIINAIGCSYEEAEKILGVYHQNWAYDKSFDDYLSILVDLTLSVQIEKLGLDLSSVITDAD